MKLTSERYHDLHSAFQKIISHYGQSKWTQFCQTSLSSTIQVKVSWGEFHDETEEIILNIARCNKMSQTINTMIHEYQHYLQPRNGWYDRHFKNGHTYDSHPYEIEANEIAARDWKLFVDG